MIHICGAPVHHPGWTLRGPGLRFGWLHRTLICSLKSSLENHIPFRGPQTTKMQPCKQGFYFFVNIGGRKAPLRYNAPGGPLSNLLGVNKNNNRKTYTQRFFSCKVFGDFTHLMRFKQRFSYPDWMRTVPILSPLSAELPQTSIK